MSVLKSFWDAGVNGLKYSTPLGHLWDAANAGVDTGLNYYEKKIEEERRKWGCEEAPLQLSPSSNAFIQSRQGLMQGVKNSRCKHITQSRDYQFYEAFKAIRGGLNAAPVVAGVAITNFIAGGIAAVLPKSIRGHFLNAVAWVNQQIYSLLNFDLQISDEAIDKISYRFVGLAGQTGEILGKSVGWLACGLYPVAGVAVFNPARARELLKEVGEEGFEEVAGEVLALAKMATRKVQQAAYLQIFKNARRWLKDPKSPFYGLLVNKFGKETIDQWGNPGNKPWSVNLAVEEWIESFNSVELQDFLEETYEGLIDGCQEGFLTFANSYSQDLLDQPERKTIEIKAIGGI